MAQTSAFIHPTTTITTFDHPASDRIRAAGVRFDCVSVYLTGEDDTGRIQSCDSLIAAVTRIREAAHDRLREAVPA